MAGLRSMFGPFIDATAVLQAADASSAIAGASDMWNTHTVTAGPFLLMAALDRLRAVVDEHNKAVHVVAAYQAMTDRIRRLIVGFAAAHIEEYGFVASGSEPAQTCSALLIFYLKGDMAVYVYLSKCVSNENGTPSTMYYASTGHTIPGSSGRVPEGYVAFDTAPHEPKARRDEVPLGRSSGFDFMWRSGRSLEALLLSVVYTVAERFSMVDRIEAVEARVVKASDAHVIDPQDECDVGVHVVNAYRSWLEIEPCMRLLAAVAPHRVVPALMHYDAEADAVETAVRGDAAATFEDHTRLLDARFVAISRANNAMVFEFGDMMASASWLEEKIVDVVCNGAMSRDEGGGVYMKWRIGWIVRIFTSNSRATEAAMRQAVRSYGLTDVAAARQGKPPYGKSSDWMTDGTPLIFTTHPPILGFRNDATPFEVDDADNNASQDMGVVMRCWVEVRAFLDEANRYR